MPEFLKRFYYAHRNSRQSILLMMPLSFVNIGFQTYTKIQISSLFFHRFLFIKLNVNMLLLVTCYTSISSISMLTYVCVALRLPHVIFFTFFPPHEITEALVRLKFFPLEQCHPWYLTEDCVRCLCVLLTVHWLHHCV